MQVFPSETRDGRTADGLVTALRPLDATAPYIAAWRALSSRALVENLFYEPDFALAGGQAFGAGVNLMMVCDRPPEEPGSRLFALWPCRIVHRWGVPLPVLMGWTHGFSIFGGPLIDRDQPARALAALLDAPGSLGLPRRLLMPYLPLDGPIADLFAQALAPSGGRRADFSTHDRGFLDLATRDETERAGYLAGQLSGRRARQLERLARRLEAAGPVVFETVTEPEALAEALDDYIALENSGWKGRAGTAVGRRPREIAFLHRLVAVLGARGRIRIDRLRRDGRSLAASIGLRTDTTFWYLKISFAEAEAKNSPGAQLAQRVTQSVLSDPTLMAADSCAPPGFTMIDTFWVERRALAHSLIEAGGADALFSLAVRLERLRALSGRPRALASALRKRFLRA